jgi:hypothetical protein
VTCRLRHFPGGLLLGGKAFHVVIPKAYGQKRTGKVAVVQPRTAIAKRENVQTLWDVSLLV